MKPLPLRGIALCGALLPAFFLPAQAQTASGLWFTTTESQVWQLQDAVLEDKVIGIPEIVLDADKVQQTFKGWGTCFNELGYDALVLLPQDVQEEVMRRMFAPDGDLRFTIGRIPVGASDYARSWYSCDETEDNQPDFGLEHFTIERDKEALIPYIQFARQYNPDMTFWASPWSPPCWMKTNKNYANATGPGSDVDIPVYFNDQFIMEPEYLDAYSRYFGKFVDAYRAEDIPITALMYQNEAYTFNIYPTCSWTAQGTATFLGEYLGPYFSENYPDVELIVGTMNTASIDVFEEILQHTGVREYFTGFGLQWEGRGALRELAYRHPDLTFQQTESECGSGTFDWAAGEWTFYLINQYVGGGCEKYTYWNAVLKDNGSSTWDWLQNALVRVDSESRTAEYTPEYYAFKHYSHFIAPGSDILQGYSTGTSTDAQVLAARTLGGAIVIVAGNPADSPREITMNVDGKYLYTTLPANSFNSFVFGGETELLEILVDEAKAIDTAGLDAATAQELAEATEAAQAAVDSGDDTQAAEAAARLKAALQQAVSGNTTLRDSLQQLYDRGTALAQAAFEGLDAYTEALEAAQAALQDSTATDDGLSAAAAALNEATRAYLESSGATADAPADFSGLIINADFSDWDNGWTQANVMVDGDCKAWTIMERTCYNNWSDNFTSMDLYQDLAGLIPGWYSVTASSLCGPGEITDQHVYASSGGLTATSPVKTVGLWSTEGWETQTTEKVEVGEDGCLRVGYASTSGGSTMGWFCVTDFKLEYYGTEADEADMEAARQKLAELLGQAAALTPQLRADQTRLQAATESAQAVAEAETATLQQLLYAYTVLDNAMKASAASDAALETYYGETLPAAEALEETLQTATARTVLQGLTEAQQAQLEADSATSGTVVLCNTLLEASLDYFGKLDEACILAADALYAEEERAALQYIIDGQAADVAGVERAVAFTDMVRQLDEAMLAVRKTQLPGDDSDYTFAIQSPDVETYGIDGDPAGWMLSLTNGDTKVKNGEHYSGNTADRYFDAYNITPGWLYYTGHQSIEGLPNGTYRLLCAARSSGEGAFITARTATQQLMQEIIKYGTEGNTGGPIWEAAAEGSAEKAANGGLGYGWQTVEISGISVTDNRLDIGFTNDRYLTGQEWTGTWFSVDDFRLFYVSDDATAISPTPETGSSGFRVVAGKGRIEVYADAPYRIYNLSGLPVNRENGLPAGIYIVKCGQQVRKVLVP